MFCKLQLCPLTYVLLCPVALCFLVAYWAVPVLSQGKSPLSQDNNCVLTSKGDLIGVLFSVTDLPSFASVSWMCLCSTFFSENCASWCSAFCCITICTSEFCPVSVNQVLCTSSLLALPFISVALLLRLFVRKTNRSPGWFLRSVFGFEAGVSLFITWGSLLLRQLLCAFQQLSVKSVLPSRSSCASWDHMNKPHQSVFQESSSENLQIGLTYCIISFPRSPCPCNPLFFQSTVLHQSKTSRPGDATIFLQCSAAFQAILIWRLETYGYFLYPSWRRNMFSWSFSYLGCVHYNENTFWLLEECLLGHSFCREIFYTTVWPASWTGSFKAWLSKNKLVTFLLFLLILPFELLRFLMIVQSKVNSYSLSHVHILYVLKSE